MNTNGQKEFDFRLDSEGAYALYINSKLWLENGPTFFNADGKTWSVDDPNNPLVLRNVSSISGGDVYEKWQERQLTYSLGDSDITVTAAIRIYTYSIYPVTKVLFRQIYPVGAVQTSKGILSLKETIAGFPSFQVKDPDEKLGFLSYGGDMFGNSDKVISTFNSQTNNINDGIEGGPFALFNKAGKAVVISPYDNFMAASLWHSEPEGGVISWGIMGGVNEIPANFSYNTLLMYYDGINNAFQAWGNTLQRQFGYSNWLERHNNVKNDISLNYLGYWTDNGAYYYYHPETNKSYEESLLDVKSYSVGSQIPYRYLQIDSWWYPKDVIKAVLTWTPMPGIFPDGIKSLSKKTGWPLAAHNRYWSKKTPYAKDNGGNFTFVMDVLGSLPDDQSFWDYLLSQAKEWGLFMYEQDWLYVQTLYMEALQKNLTLGHDWLMQMASAAARNKQTIQYCMGYSRHALQSLEFPTVTQARVSEDYLTLEDQWKVGVSSILARALRIQPSKDTFWTTSVQPGNPYNKKEPHPALEAAVATLTAGPVGPGDMINYTDIELLMRCCRKDGRLLKPSRPITAIDKQLITDAFRDTTSESSIGEIWSTQSFIEVRYGGLNVTMGFGILLAADISRPFSVSVSELGFTELSSKGFFYPYTDVKQGKEFNSSTVIDLTNCSKTNFCLYYFSPYLDHSSLYPVILGEASKWVPVSEDRIQYISIDSAQNLDLGLQPSSTTENFNVTYIADGEIGRAHV